MADEATSTDTTTSQTDAAPEGSPAADDVSVLGGATADAPVVDASKPAADAGKEGAQAKEGEGANEAPTGAPEKYELALEGLTLDDGLLADAEPILRELNLTNDQANALLPLAPKIMDKARDALTQQMLDGAAQQRKAWLDAFVADKDIGGAKREESEHLAAKGLDALGFAKDHPFRQVFNETGLGNHPDLIRTFRQIGEMVSDDGSLARPNAGDTKQVLSFADRMFPDKTT